MIGRLTGVVLERQPPSLLVDVHGVGYELEAPMSTFYALPGGDRPVTLYTHLVVREDAQQLYGFASADERRLFRALIKVNGIGARLALAILSGIEVREFASCVELGDTARLTSLPGIGKRTAERLIVEMRDRLSDWSAPVAGAAGPQSPAPAGDAVADAVSALVALGYKPAEASRHVHALETAGRGSEDLIREALKAMVRA